MAKVTIEVPEVLVGDIYMAVGTVLQLGQDELDKATALAAPRLMDDDDEPAEQA